MRGYRPEIDPENESKRPEFKDVFDAFLQSQDIAEALENWALVQESGVNEKWRAEADITLIGMLRRALNKSHVTISERENSDE